MAQSYATVLNLISAGCVGLIATAVAALLSSQCSLYGLGFLGIICSAATSIALTCQYLRQMRPCNTLSWNGFIQMAKTRLLTATLGRYSVWNLKRAYRSGSRMLEMQHITLMKHVARSRNTVFGRDHGFAEIRGIDDFRARVPVRDYAELHKYNQLAYRGEPNVFFPGRVEFLFKTSGTTGKNKTFPGARRFLKDFATAFLATKFCFEEFTRKSGRRCSMARQLMTSVHSADKRNEFGVPTGPLSKFVVSRGDILTTPVEPFQRVHDAKAAFYIHAVFALWHDRIGDVSAFYPTTLSTFIRCVIDNWDSVLSDIERGRLSADKVGIEPELLAALNSHLSPKPARAAQLRALFGDGQDLSGFFEKAWPDIPCVMLARSGSFQSSYRYLRKYLGNLPTFGSVLSGSEGFVGININVKEVDCNVPERYNPMLSPSFVEFVPVDAGGSDVGEAKLAHELEVGGLYETVLTSFKCFRVRSGDVIRIVAMDRCAPVFELSHRKSHMLSVDAEKTTENALQSCVLLAAERLNCHVIDFSAAECFLYEPVAGTCRGTKYYALFVELDGDRRLAEDDKQLFDQTLRESSEHYDQMRVGGRIDTMQVLQVKLGAFAALRLQMMRRNDGISEFQFKMPRVLRSEDSLRCLLDGCL